MHLYWVLHTRVHTVTPGSGHSVLPNPNGFRRPFDGMRGGKPMGPGMVNPMMEAMGPIGPMGGPAFMGMPGAMGPMAGHMRPMAGRGMRPGMMHGGMPGRGRF